MTIFYINTGSGPNQGDGDTLRTAFNKINANFGYLSTATSASTSTRWDAVPAVSGCPIYTELTPDHFYAYTQQSHIELENTGYWNVGSNYYGTFIGSDYPTFTNLIIAANDSTGTVTIETAGTVNKWIFDQNGNLTLPTGYSIGGNTNGNDGIALTTDRGTILFGNHPECVPTLLTHFHIMKEDASAVDLFLGDDYNFVKLPGAGETAYGVEIGTNVGSAYTWRFGTDGTLTIPGDATLSTENGLVGPDGGYSQLSDYALNNFVWVDSTGAHIGTNFNSSGNTWFFDEDGNLTLPLSSKINSGGIGTTNAVEFGTVVATNPFPPNEGVANITNSEIYMSGGSAESRIITDSTSGSLIYSGVEHVEIPAFAGMVAVDAGVTSQYSIATDNNGNILIGATQDSGVLTTNDYTAGLGVLNYNFNINGILARTDATYITGAAGISMATDRGQVLFGNQPEGLTSPNHWHIMKSDSSFAMDLFFGDDYNYVKLPGLPYAGGVNKYSPLDDGRNFGVNIATQNLAEESEQYVWRFNTAGGLEFPDNTVQTTAWDYSALDNIDMDGGSASTIYSVNIRFAEGGAAGTRFSKNDPIYTGANAYGSMVYDFTLDGGRA